MCLQTYTGCEINRTDEYTSVCSVFLQFAVVTWNCSEQNVDHKTIREEAQYITRNEITMKTSEDPCNVHIIADFY